MKEPLKDDTSKEVMMDWKQCIEDIDDVKELDYISSIASARRQVIDAEKRKDAKPSKKGDNPYGFPVESDEE